MEEGAVEEVMDLRDKLESMEAKVATLEARLVEAEANTNRIAQTNTGTVAPVDDHLADKISGGEKSHGRSVGSTRWPLSPGEYTRYGRQMIMPEIGLEGWLVPPSSVWS